MHVVDQARHARKAWARARKGTACVTEEFYRDRDFSVATDLSNIQKKKKKKLNLWIWGVT